MLNSPRRVIAIAAAIATALTFMAGSVDAKTVLKLGNVHAPGMPVQAGVKYFADLVRERTKGDVDIQIYPAAQLGGEQQILTGVHLGTIDMFDGSAGAVGRFLPQLDAFACPFLWKSPSSMVSTVRGKIGQSLAKELIAKRQMRILDMGWIFGVRQLTTTKTPVHTPADMKGLKIRVQPDPIYMGTIRAMGGNPTPIPAKEIYTSLQTGVVDGQENPISNIAHRKLYEVQKYVMMTGHITQNEVLIIREGAFQSLTPAERKIMVEAAIEAGNYQNGLVHKAEVHDLGVLKAHGMTVIQPDVAAFRQATKNVCRTPELAKRWGSGFFDKLAATQQ